MYGPGTNAPGGTPGIPGIIGCSVLSKMTHAQIKRNSLVRHNKVHKHKHIHVLRPPEQQHLHRTREEGAVGDGVPCAETLAEVLVE